MKNIFITHYVFPVGKLIIGSYNDQLCLCDWDTEKRRATIDRRIQRHLHANYCGGYTEIIDQTIRQLAEYFAGQRTAFDIPLLFTGSDFQNAVWNELTHVPYGTTLSYAELAQRIGRPNAVRAVANANAQNPISIFVPCHRIIGSNHKLTGYGGGLPAKEALLRLENALPKE